MNTTCNATGSDTVNFAGIDSLLSRFTKPH